MFVYHIAESVYDFFGRLTTDRTEAIAAAKNGLLVAPILISRINYQG